MRLALRPLELAAVDALAVDAWAIFVGRDERPLQGLGGLLDWRLAGRLSQVLQDELFRGDEGESLLVPSGGHVPGRRIFCFGLGAPSRALAAPQFGETARRAVEALAKAGVGATAFGLPEAPVARLSARLLVDALAPLSDRELTILGDPRELALSLPEWATSLAG